VQFAQDLSRAWFRAEDTVGITAGTSTPDVLVESVESAIRQMAWPQTPIFPSGAVVTVAQVGP
jgi:4-hydroxy-3-methylbut-2-enyl diphosphate reductase IspH